MHRLTPLLCLLALPISAQTTTQPTTTLQASTQLVVVDVVVEDRNGNPIHGLKAEDFVLSEDKTPQTIHNFEEHSTLNPPPAGPALPKLPPGTYTDYTPVPPTGTLNILLLDALNTPMKDQSFVRQQLQDYVKHADPGTRIAIFGLSSSLIMLQGFTSDPETLKNVVDHKLIPRASHLLDDPVSGDEMNQPIDSIDTSAPSMAANLAQFEAQMSAMQVTLRAQYTLDAFNTLAHYLAALPGRKNLIWFSGSFPLSILPNPALANPFAVMQVDEAEFRETTNLLTKAQVAVYPVDARGLMVAPMFSASTSGSKYAHSPTAFSNDVQRFAGSQAAEHGTMNELADATGGHAFYDTNGLAQAVAKAIRAGSNYYTLTYTPTNRKHNGDFRDIHVVLAPAKAANVQLSYRHGYFSDTPTLASAKSSAGTTTTPANAASSSVRSGTAYARAAMARGAPTPEDILFKARVLPASLAAETTVAPGNDLDPIAPAKGPFHRFDIDLAALSNEVTTTLQPDGTRTAEIAFQVNVYDRAGRLLNTTGRGFKLTLKPDVYQAFLKSPLQCHMEISVPDRTEAYLRIGVIDTHANRFGVVEIPVAEVARLTPPVYPAAAPAPATPSTSPAPPPAPSTPHETSPPAH